MFFAGEVIYNRTYTIERSTVIPIEISSANGGSSQGLGETSSNSGFQVHTIDLGNAGGLAGVEHAGGRQASGETTSGQDGRYYSQNFGSAENSRGSAYGQSRSSASQPGGQGYRRQWQTEGSFSHSGTIPPTLFNNNLEERDNVPADATSRSARSRGKRQIDDDPYTQMQALVKCNSTNCMYIRCVVGVLEKDKDVAIALRSRLNVRAIRDVSIEFSSSFLSFPEKFPSNANNSKSIEVFLLSL